ncbi:hypothetical protein GCM10010353_65870 [Streptomyces chryseus]|nr:hypothetical protein GCM10010353_65870 [Streptomyces chryseus]
MSIPRGCGPPGPWPLRPAQGSGPLFTQAAGSGDLVIKPEHARRLALWPRPAAATGVTDMPVSPRARLDAGAAERNSPSCKTPGWGFPAGRLA